MRKGRFKQENDVLNQEKTFQNRKFWTIEKITPKSALLIRNFTLNRQENTQRILRYILLQRISNFSHLLNILEMEKLCIFFCYLLLSTNFHLGNSYQHRSHKKVENFPYRYDYGKLDSILAPPVEDAGKFLQKFVNFLQKFVKNLSTQYGQSQSE